MPSEGSLSQGPHIGWLHLYKIFRIGKTLETARGWVGDEDGRWLVTVMGFVFGVMEMSEELDSGDVLQPVTAVKNQNTEL